jgi:tetratricopeptide (TPR) repeat protein
MENTPLPTLIENARQAYQAEEYELAASNFQAAVDACRAAGDELNAAEMANNCSVARLMGSDPQGALQAVEGTAEIFARAGDLRRQGMALANQAAALEALKKDPEALALYEQSSELLKQSGEKEMRSQVQKNISSLQLRTGKQVAALASMQVALDNQPRLTVKDRFLKRLIDQAFKLLHR